MFSTSPIFDKARKLLAHIMPLALAGALLNTPVSLLPSHATDLDAPITDSTQPVEDDGQFVRIGMNKSAVIRLPAEARDVIVGNPDIIDAVVRRKNMVYIFARNVGQSNVFFFDANGEQILHLDVEVSVDMLGLKKLIKRTIPGSRITVDTMNRNVILGGTAANAAEAKTAVDLAKQFANSGGGSGEVVDTIKILGEDQVMLKVKVIEIQRDVLKQLGVDLQAAIAAGSTIFNIASINPFNTQLFSPNQGFAATDDTGNFRFDSVVRAMETDGLIRTLAEPNLTAITGQQAKFLAGGEFPFELCTVSNGVRDCQLQYKEFGVKLEFKPTVMSAGRINLAIKTEVSEITSLSTSSNTQSIPALNSRKAETVLEMPSGGSMMIAGLIRETTRQNLNGTPGLKKLPILGALFRSREFRSNETELVVMVTPFIVTPVAQSQLTSPDENLHPTSERQALFMGRLNRTYGASGKPPSGTYHGNVGFIVE